MFETPKEGIVAPSRAGRLEVPVTPRNPGMPLELEWLEEVRVNRSAVERRAATLRARRTVKKEWQAAWLLRAVTLMDLTTLSSRSEEHTSELQSRLHLVCRLLLEKKKTKTTRPPPAT